MPQASKVAPVVTTSSTNKSDTDFWELRNAEEAQKANPATFDIPELHERQNLKVGKVAKLIFEIVLSKVILDGESCLMCKIHTQDVRKVFWRKNYILLLLLCIMYPLNLMAQNSPESPKNSVFTQLFPNPTGNNGYEDAMKAGDLLTENKLIDEMMKAKTPIEQKREFIYSAKWQKARHLIRTGLSKPIFLPPQVHGKENFRMIFPEYMLFRKLVQGLAVEITVLFADGKATDAIDSLRDGLSLGHYTQQGPVISGLVGVAIEKIVIEKFSNYLEQLSSQNCDQLLSILDSLPKQPRVLVLIREQEFSNYVWKHEIKDAVGFRKYLLELYKDIGSPLEQKLKKLSKGQFKTLAEEVKRHTLKFTENRIERAKKPAWERKTLPPPPKTSLAWEISRDHDEVFANLPDLYDELEAMINLLGTHTAIHKFRLEKKHLPKELAELQLKPAMTIDSFTGKPLNYQPQEQSYELYSVGRWADWNPSRLASDRLRKTSRTRAFPIRTADRARSTKCRGT